MTFLLECSLRAALITAIGLGMTSLLAAHRLQCGIHC